MIEINEIDEAVEYILSDETPVCRKEDKPVKMDKPNLKLKAIEGENGVYYIEGESVRLERKQAYVNFDTKKEFVSWIKEFEAVYDIAEKGIFVVK